VDIAAALDLARNLADEADAITMARFRAHDLRVATKPDLTPVSEADEAVERAIRDRLAAYPGHAVLGEEFDDHEPDDAEWRWIIDPIDGTKNFSRGIPVWASLIALERDGVVVCGVASAPALGRRWWAARGEGAYRDGERIHVSQIARIEEATVSFSRSGLGDPRTIELVLRSWHGQPFSDFWAHLLVAEGAVEVAVEHVMNIWDNAVLQVIVEEAGGRFTDLRGEARIDGGSGVSTNGVLHDEVLATFSDRR
jgi:histidinol-phosphatase